jgi:maltose-binding protein MalE
MKHTTRIIIAILVLAMMLPMALACAETNGPEDTTAGSADTQAPSLDATTEAEETMFALSDIPEDLRFDGETIKFLYWDDVENPEFFVEDQNGEAVNDAIYNRNAKVEEQFGVTLEFTGTPGNFNNQSAFVNQAVNSTQAGADAHDFFCGYSMSGATLMCQGIAQDLTDYSIIEFDKPWWPASLIGKATIKDGVYFASGDISTNFLYMMYLCVFNKDLFTDITQLENKALYEMVDNGEWTIDKFIELASGVYVDQNGDATANQGDRFGFVSHNIHFDSFYTAANLFTVVPAEDGTIKLSEDLFSEKTQNLLTKMGAFLHESGDCFFSSDQDIFAAGEALFTINRAQITNKKLTATSFSYGILPVPKYDAEQEEYYTCMAFPFTTYVLSTASTHPEAAAATLELMAYQSYMQITPALFEEAMKLRYADQSDDSFMFDLIRETVVIDLGRLLTNRLDNLSYSLFRGAMNNNQGSSWASLEKANTKLFNRKITDINKAIEKLG